MKRVFQALTIALAVGAIIQTVWNAFKNPASAQNQDKPKTTLIAQGEPGI